VALAQTLEHRPVDIYNWVRHNIKFMPTYGATQSVQQTLDMKRGNAFDIASLLIALYCEAPAFTPVMSMAVSKFQHLESVIGYKSTMPKLPPPYYREARFPTHP